MHCYGEVMLGEYSQEEDCCMKLGLPSLQRPVGHVARKKHKPRHAPRRNRAVGRDTGKMATGPQVADVFRKTRK